MSYVKGSQLPATSTVADTDTLIVTQEGDSKATKKVAKSDLLKEDRTRLTNLETDNTTNKSNITNLQKSLENKAEKNHTHDSVYVKQDGSTPIIERVQMPRGSYAHEAVGAGISGNWMLIAEINIKSYNINQPLEFNIAGRNRQTSVTLWILFESINGTDPALISFKYNNAKGYQPYLVKKATSTWSLYIYKSDSYDFLDIIDVHIPKYTSTVVTYKSTTVSTLPEGGTYASPLQHAITDVTGLQSALDSKAPEKYNLQFEGAISSAFREKIIGTTDECGFVKSFRKLDTTDACMPQFGSGIAWGQGDTHGMLYVDYSNSVAYIAGGNGDKLNWHKKLAWKDDLTSYLPLSGGTITGNINFMNAVLIGRTITGEASNEINHRIVIGGNGDNKMLFDEYGGDFYFRRTKDGTINQMARITSDGIYEGATLLKDKYALIGHSHTNISPLGRKAPMTGRNAINGIYCYSTSGDDSTGSTMPSGYCVVIGFGDGTGGSAEIAISYTGNGMWFRYLRDYQDNWSSWTRLK